MDIFRFTNPTRQTLMEGGELINGLKRKTWIERYAKTGEFELVGPAHSDLRNLLPIGSFISHVDTSEIMMVENHEINDDKGKQSEIKITGRGFETILEQRFPRPNTVYPRKALTGSLVLPADHLGNQIRDFINNHVAQTSYIEDQIKDVLVFNESIDTGEAWERTLDKSDVYSQVVKLLPIDSLGIKVIRPGSPNHPEGPTDPNVAIVVHKGVDRSSSLSFSYDTGEVTSSDYLWSNKNLKNTAFVTTTWYQKYVETGATGTDRRVMHVDLSWIDEMFETEPDPSWDDVIIPYMDFFGQEALIPKKETNLINPNIADRNVSSTYREDYQLGDIITVNGDYDTDTTLRVVEYVEIEDERGESGYPTFDTV